LKNIHLLRYARPSSLRRTEQYASFLRISRALHLNVFDQPEKKYFFNNLLEGNSHHQKSPGRVESGRGSFDLHRRQCCAIF